MNNNRFYIFFCVLLSNVFAQHCRAENLAAWEDSISTAYQAMAQSDADTERLRQSDQMRSFFIRSFDDPDVFDYAFEKLNFCTLISPDQHIRLFNWNLPFSDGSFKYFCFVLIRQPSDRSVAWVELIDNPRDPDQPESKFLSSDKWMGALYYEIIPVYEKKQRKKNTANTYILLGWDGKDNITTRKIIEGLTITGTKIRLGAALFDMGKATKKRVILEYNNEVSALLKYYPKQKSIVYDHLSPRTAGMEGIYSEYGPDGTYNLFRFQNGKWMFYENVDIKEFAEKDDRIYNDPKKMR